MQLKDQPNGMSPLQQAEEKIKILTEQLNLKDGVILQHAKVAEEAVSGQLLKRNCIVLRSLAS
jgi:hypothetical protein